MGGTHAYSSVWPAGIRPLLWCWWVRPLVGLGAACGPHWCTLVQAKCLYWCTLWCSSPLLVEEATLACTGVRWDLLVVTAGLGFQERRPVGEQPAREEVDRAATSVSSRHPQTITSPSSPSLSFKPCCCFFGGPSYHSFCPLISSDQGFNIWGGRRMIGHWEGETEDSGGLVAHLNFSSPL